MGSFYIDTVAVFLFEFKILLFSLFTMFYVFVNLV